jgi:environmental stress-induced protein Ves
MNTPACERFDLQEIAPQPWKNGAGLTREIAVSPAGATPETFDWRISVAEVERDAPFSAFPGIDRCIVLLRGSGMLLHGADGGLVHRLDRRHEPFHFSGDLPLDATLLGGPSTDFNVMTRRGRFCAEVTRHSGEARLPESDAGLLLCSEGNWQIEGPSALKLGPLEGLLYREGRPVLSVRSRRPGPESCLLLVSLECHHLRSGL